MGYIDHEANFHWRVASDALDWLIHSVFLAHNDFIGPVWLRA